MVEQCLVQKKRLSTNGPSDSRSSSNYSNSVKVSAPFPPSSGVPLKLAKPKQEAKKEQKPKKITSQKPEPISKKESAKKLLAVSFHKNLGAK